MIFLLLIVFVLAQVDDLWRVASSTKCSMTKFSCPKCAPKSVISKTQVFFSASKFETFANIAVNAVYKSIFVTFQSTSPVQDVFFQENYTEVSNLYNGKIPADCKAYGDFYKSWNDLKVTFLPKIIEARKKYPKFEIFFLGHSLGGAIANFAAIDFVLADGKPASVSVVTFGAPKFANLEFVNWINAYPFKVYYRYVAVGDIVPHLPLIPGVSQTKNHKTVNGRTITDCVQDPVICLGTRDWVSGWKNNENYFGISSGC